MALVVKDRIKETTTTTGTGTLTLAGAVTKFQSFSVVGDGNTTYYAIESGNGTDWEIGVGTYTASSTTLSRDTILESSNAGSAISLTGTSTVFCTYPAERSVNTEDIGSTIQAYDADTAKYDDTTANFTGTLQNGGSNVVVDTDIGSTVQAYDADTAKYDDATANFTGNLQKSGANVLTGNQTITLSGDATGSGTTAITVTVVDDSHNHIISNVDGLQTALDAKAPIASPTFTGTATTPNLQITSGALIRDVTGSYGSIEIDGGATGGWEGYNIGGWSVFMSQGTASGIYNDANNQWIIYGAHNGATDLRYAGSVKIATNSGGVTVTGTCTATSFSGDGSALTGIAVTPTAVSGQTNSATSYFDLPAGTTAQRPGSPNVGMIRYNTTENKYEVYTSGGTWQFINANEYPYTVEYLIIAGGAGGGSRHAGGGGAGGVISGSVSVNPPSTYGVTVGAGGAAHINAGNTDIQGNAGGNSSVFGATAIGGGGGGCNGVVGLSGGSGGGDGERTNRHPGASGTSGQGNAGGGSTTNYGGGGGGGGKGAGGARGATPFGKAGDGGAGSNAWSTWATATSSGVSGYYAGGGGGGGYQVNSFGLGGSGGGGRGGEDGTPGLDATGSTGSGGGGGGQTGAGNRSGGGGSGLVILRYAGTQKGSGGTVYNSGGYTYHKFTSSGTFSS